MTNATRTEEVEITDWDDFQDGDVVVQRPNLDGSLTRFLVSREVPLPPKPKLGTFGTAVVDGKRMPGVIDEDGDFVFQTWSDETGANTEYTSHFDDFRPDGVFLTHAEISAAIRADGEQKTFVDPELAADRVLALLKEKNS